MRTVTFQAVLQGVFAKIKRSLADQDSEAVEEAIAAVASRLATAWEYYLFPELMAVQRRQFRAEWKAQAYDADAEVYHAGSGKYWVASTAVTAADEPAEGSSVWAELVDFRRTVGWDQAGKDAIGAAVRAWDKDPLVHADARRLNFALSAEGVEFGGEAPVSVWLQFRRRAPDATAAVYDAATAYAAGVGVYVAPDCYQVLAATTAGETPAGAPAKFAKIDFPAVLAEAVKAGAVADLLAADAQPEKASWWDGKFTELLDEQVWQLTKLQGQTGQQ